MREVAIGHVGVAHDHVEAAEKLAVGVRLVARIDDRPAGHRGAGHLVRDVLGALAQTVDGPRTDSCRIVPAPGEDLATEARKGISPLHEAGKGRGARHEVVLVAAVGVPRRVPELFLNACTRPAIP